MIAAAVIEMARVLDIRVVAEGVETAEQHRAVGELGCGYCQGYYFARPLTADGFRRLLGSGAADGDLRLPPPAS